MSRLHLIAICRHAMPERLRRGRFASKDLLRLDISKLGAVVLYEQKEEDSPILGSSELQAAQPEDKASRPVWWQSPQCHPDALPPYWLLILYSWGLYNIVLGVL